MEKNENGEVLQGEVVEEPQKIPPALAANEASVEKKESGLEKAGNWIDTIAFLGAGIFKLIAIFSKSTPFAGHEQSGKNDSSSGRRRRRQGRNF